MSETPSEGMKALLAIRDALEASRNVPARYAERDDEAMAALSHIINAYTRTQAVAMLERLAPIHPETGED